MGGCGCERGCGLCNGIDVGEWEGVSVNVGADCVMGLTWVTWVSRRVWV